MKKLKLKKSLLFQIRRDGIITMIKYVKPKYVISVDSSNLLNIQKRVLVKFTRNGKKVIIKNYLQRREFKDYLEKSPKKIVKF